MPAKATSSLDPVATHYLWRLALFCTFVPVVMLLASFKILGDQGWSGWLAWAGRILVAGLLAYLWYSTTGSCCWRSGGGGAKSRPPPQALQPTRDGSR